MTRITTTTNYEVKYFVCYYEATEGGMDFDTFGKTTSDLKEALFTLEIAKTVHPTFDWVITLDVTRSTT